MKTLADKIITINITIDKSKQSKIAWDMGRYANDLPDETEIEDWLNQKMIDIFDELPEARQI